MSKYTITVDLPADVPLDVVQEYIGAALKRFVLDRTTVSIARLQEPTIQPASLKGPTVAKLRKVRNHPFEGPEVFDDEVTVATFATVPENLHDLPAHPIQGEYPHLSAILSARRQELQGEGDWQLIDDDHTGEDR